MEFNFLEYFYTDKFDNDIIVENSKKSFCVGEIKKLVANCAKSLNEIDEKNIIIRAKNNFDFIIIFLACIFANKDIYIVSTNCKTVNIKESKEITEPVKSNACDFEFKKIDPSSVNINFSTSGTTSVPKIIKKDLSCLFRESRELISSFAVLKNKKSRFITTAPLNHLFAVTFYLFLGLNSRNIINTDKINYVENLNVKNAILATSPSFLMHIQKHGLRPEHNLNCIITAGSKLNKDTHGYFEKHAKTVINIYGSTETGIIGSCSKSTEVGFKLFKGITIKETCDKQTTLISKYSKPEETVINDRIKLINDNTIELLGRCDRLFKIREKRISAKEIEDEIIKTKIEDKLVIKNSRLVELNGQIGAIAALSEYGCNFILKNGMPAFIKILNSTLNKNFAIIPKKWKFIDELPVNEMGKIDSKKIDEIFSTNISLPLVIKRKKTGESAEFELFFQRNCNFYKGHFDNFPITPGVVQLFYAAFFAQSAFNINCHTGQIRRIKFSNIIHPDSVIKLCLTKNQKGIEFEYRNENKVYSSGCLPLVNIFQGAQNE